MPRISRFHGISIAMFFNESLHAGRPHFHAEYGGEWASFDARDLTRIAGKLPLRIERLVRTWARINQAQLLKNWELGRTGNQFETIEPLK